MLLPPADARPYREHWIEAFVVAVEKLRPQLAQGRMSHAIATMEFQTHGDLVPAKAALRYHRSTPNRKS